MRIQKRFNVYLNIFPYKISFQKNHLETGFKSIKINVGCFFLPLSFPMCECAELQDLAGRYLCA